MLEVNANTVKARGLVVKGVELLIVRLRFHSAASEIGRFQLLSRWWKIPKRALKKSEAIMRLTN